MTESGSKITRSFAAGGLAAAAVAVVAGCSQSREELAETHESTLASYCTDCHNDLEQVGELSLEGLNLADVAAHRETWEKVVRKLRAGMMPPPDGPRPDEQTYRELVSFISGELDASYEEYLPPPGAHRLNRAEYANVIRDLLGLAVDAAEFLPSDDSSRGFDNQAGTLSLSPALLEAYLSAAGKISRLALGHVDRPTQAVYRVAEDTTQNYHVEGLPFGTRGGVLIDHWFPADGEYNLKIFAVNLGNMGNFRPFGEVRGEQLEVLLDGERVALLDWDEEFNLNRGFGGGQGELETIDVRLPVTAGPHEVGVTFLATNYAPLLDLNDAFERSTIETGGLPGYTFYPHIGRVRIDGPYEANGAGDTPARQRIFVCRPSGEADEEACAERIVSRLAHRAYRGFDTEQDVATLMEFYEEGREQGGFEAGIGMALQRVLVDPKFIYRIEREPRQVAPGEVYALSDLEVASRLSFFLWSSMPDDELLELAEQNRLSEPGVLAEQVRRMIEDPRSKAFTENFAGQWLALRNLEGHAPVVDAFPDFDDNLRQAFRRETELFFDSILREDRGALELLTADYTFVNDRLAKHYGIDGVQGSHFRRIELGEELDVRRGLLGKGSLLTATAQPGRTSPVIRGNWILTNLIGVPPPPPPPNVPALEPKVADAAGNERPPSMREQLEQHRDNPACLGCHMLMDPFGFALEPFDAIGRYRTNDSGNPIDASDVMYDGTPVEGPADVRRFVLKYSDQFLHNLAEKLLTYALGRGVEYYDMPVVRQIVAKSAEEDHTLTSMITAIAESRAFRMNTKSAEAKSGEGATRPVGVPEGVTQEAPPAEGSTARAAGEASTARAN
ncbi:MAG: DUF1592 domain-containing protein [Gammaproteobacteria bacterium]|nr:DUF1592 domain-containing protein [Gammaproteobacteria bacterium]